MTRSFNHSGLYVNIVLLRNHISKLQAEKKLSLQLYENVSVMKVSVDPVIAYQFDSVLRDIEQLIKYFDAMISYLAHIDDEAIQLSYDLHSIINDSTIWAQHITTKKFVL